MARWYLWFLLASLLAFFVPSDHVAIWKALEARHASATGTIVDIDCDDYEKVSYRFAVNGVEFDGSFHHVHDEPCLRRSIGDAITIYYAPGMPYINTPITPAQTVRLFQRRQKNRLLLAEALLLVAGIVWAAGGALAALRSFVPGVRRKN